MEEAYNLSTQLLKEPLSLAELLDTGTHFEVDFNGNLDYEDFNVDDDEDDLNEEIENEGLVSPWKNSFAELRKLMTPISEDIYKRVTRAGVKEKGMVPAYARVALSYSAYWERELAPFDSSMLRGSKFEFETGRHTVVEGLEAAVRTMYEHEQSEFIISYKMLFLEMGCPPRIKPRADGLFKIEVLGFTLIGDKQSLEQIPAEDRNKFSVVYPKAKDMHLHGKDCAKRKVYRGAITAFESAIASLNYCRLADDNDELMQTELLITLYTNVMVCYNKLSKPSRVCLAMKALRLITKNQPSCKALFQEGRALAALGDYKHARKAFVKAQAKQPNNQEISQEIVNMEERVSKYKKSMREIWSRAMVGKQEAQEKVQQESELASVPSPSIQQLKRDFQLQLNVFENSSAQTIPMSRKIYSDNEFDVLRLLSAQHNMKLSMSPLDASTLTLSKLQIK